MLNRSFWLPLAAWVVSLLATSGSLFFSEVMQFPPCSLCWYQRICMYPLVLLFAVPVITGANDFLKYTMPLTLIGWLIAFFHVLVRYQVIPEAVSPCAQGVPCSAVYIQWLGFLSIPLFSLMAFTLILGFSHFIFWEKR